MPIAVAGKGIIGLDQARARGMSRQQVRTLVRNGTWLKVHPGVYAVSGFPRTTAQRLMAACLWVDGFASHRSAAWLFDLMEEPGSLDVMTSKGRSSTEAVTVHRVDDLQAHDKACVEGIPCVTPTRLLCHLGSVLDEESLEVVLEEALRRRMTSVARLHRRLGSLSGRGRRGAVQLRRLLDVRGEEPPAESFLEVKAIRLLRRAHLYPARQFPVGRRRIDLAFPDVKLGIELLGGLSHEGAAARARDAVRHNELSGMGWTLLYFTYEDVLHRPDYVVAAIKAELRRLRRTQALF